MSDSQRPSKSFDPQVIAILVIGLIIVGLGILGISRFFKPIPTAEVTKSAETLVLPGQLAVNFSEQGESAVGTDTSGVIASSSDQTPIPIASVTKIMTAYLVLKAHPLQPGEDGPSLKMTAQDVADYQFGLKNNYSLVKVTLGESLTEKQLLEGLMLPSGNNIANTLGRWVAGSDQAFVAKMNETAKSLGMTNTHYADASGANEATVSNAVDQIKIAQVAMQDPAFREIVATPQAVLPVAGKVFNVNSMLGKHGIVGIKTGSGVKAKGCFVSATPVVNGTEKHYLIAAVLGSEQANQNLQSALEKNAAILDQIRPQFKSYTITPPATGFGKLTTPWNSQSELKVSQAIQVFGYPGMKVSYSIKTLPLKLPTTPGTNVSTLMLQTGKTTQTVFMQNVSQIEPPGWLWRVIRY